MILIFYLAAFIGQVNSVDMEIAKGPGGLWAKQIATRLPLFVAESS